MSRDQHAALSDLTEALYQRDVARLREVHRTEARLRAALAQLDGQARAARALPESALRGVREIGADLAWQSLLARNRAQLQSELAHVLARKEDAMPALRRSFGRAEAARALAAQAKVDAKTARDRQHAEMLADLGLIRRMGSDQVS